jgi:hypothetical protein
MRGLTSYWASNRIKHIVQGCCICLLASSGCRRELPPFTLHTDLGDLTVQPLANMPAAARALMAQFQSLSADSIAIEKVLHDGFIQWNTPINAALPAASTNASAFAGDFVVSNGHFFLVQGRVHTDATLDKWQQSSGRLLTPQARETYKSQGGLLPLEGKCCTLGKLVAGKEVLDRLTALPSDANGKPLREVRVKLLLR